ncbi:hypothetical protein KVR01_012928 [Diaporthe batatas]|uniref:uncharacterized protein n=1 Tax=Diaporthe batatas TaxID=748121 RepID=UPI001D03FBA0|nr:uncharacterized protein KVR01_012928 [Diaporthe batatas]KAG8157220.1 hypothetical protein KVR01_012928 [Diaporthe batatas]
MRQSLLSLVPGVLSLAGAAAAQGLTESSLETYVDSVTLSSSFNPIKEAYWTGYVHHRRTPLAVSPDGKTAYLAYLDASDTGVHVQPIDPTTFKAKGAAVTVAGGKEAGGLVAQDDGFALLTNEAMPSGTANAPPDSTPVPVLYRFDAAGTQKWKTWLGGPDVASGQGNMAAPDLNGDLVYSAKTGRYAAYTVVTAYSGAAQGHFGDAINYVEESSGERVTIQGATSAWGCSHNTGIALEAADEAPYASVCAEDQGAIWLNSRGQGMSTAGVKISNENVTNGGGGESLGGMSGSYSNLARFQGGDGYIFAWVSRGAKDVTTNDWMGDGYTHVTNRTNGRNVAIATFSDKYTMDGQQATSQVGAADGDSQVNWLTTGTKADQSNAHVATFDATSALVTWEEIADPFCEYVAMGCRGKFTGSKFQLVEAGKPVGEPLTSQDVTVAGDLVTMPDGRICWPYVNMAWDMSSPVGWGGSTASTTKMSFACMTNGAASGSGAAPAAPASSSAAAAPASSSAAAAPVATPSSTSAAAPATTSVPTNANAAPAPEQPAPEAPETPLPAATTTSSSTRAHRPRPTRRPYSNDGPSAPLPTSSAAAAAGEQQPPVAEAPAAETPLPTTAAEATAPRPSKRPCPKQRRAALLAARAARA